MYNFADQSSASLISITSCNSTAAPGAGHYAAAGTMSSPGMVMEQSGHIRRESGYSTRESVHSMWVTIRTTVGCQS